MEKSIEGLPAIRETTVINAPIESVWKAVATSEGLAAWFMPNDFKPEVGHAFTVDAGPWGHSPCKVVEVDPPQRLSFEWDQDWTVTFELKEENGQTQVTLIHGGWKSDGSTRFGQSHSTVRDRMGKGWVGLLGALKAYVEG